MILSHWQWHCIHYFNNIPIIIIIIITRPWPAFGRQWPSWIVGRWPVREEKTTHVLARAFGAPLGGYWSSGGDFFLPLLVQNFSFCWLWILFQSFALAKTIFLPSKIIFLRYFLLFIGRWPVLEDIHSSSWPRPCEPGSEPSLQPSPGQTPPSSPVDDDDGWQVDRLHRLRWPSSYKQISSP